MSNCSDKDCVEKRIQDLLANHNNLTDKQYQEIKSILEESVSKNDAELVEILLNEEIEVQGMTFKINKTQHTASLFKVLHETDTLVLPISIKYDSETYTITSIIGCQLFPKKIKTLRFNENSKIGTIYQKSFMNSTIETLYIPQHLKELRGGWCVGSINLRKIEISPLNNNFLFDQNKYLLGKTDPQSDNFDALLFAICDISEASIPSNIKIISSYAFHRCSKLITVKIPSDSKLQVIEEYAFANSNIKKISIPKHVLKIGKIAFYSCKNLQLVEFHEDSELQLIEENAFANSKINQISIPKHVSKIGKSAFNSCKNLQIVEFQEDSELQSFEISNNEYGNILFMVPVQMEKFKDLIK